MDKQAAPEASQEPEIQNQPKTSVSMDDLTEQEEFPAVDNEAIESILKQESAGQSVIQPAAQEAEKFDPTIHRTNPDGSPVLTKTGKFRKKTGYKLIKPEMVKPQLDVNGNAMPQRPKMTSKTAARILTSGIEKISMAAISDDFKYTAEEKEESTNLWENCLDHYGGVNLSPPWEIAAFQVGVILARMDKPKTQNRIFAGWLWLKSKFGRKAKNGALSRSGNDRGREDNLGKEKSTQSTETRPPVLDIRPV